MTDTRKFAEKLEALAAEAGRLGYDRVAAVLSDLADNLEPMARDTDYGPLMRDVNY